ncbi:CAP domain-containing protein [Streptomyces sp. NPDC051567]|uniref:CAP domain-containing protein n=1 Tax=Streptomyces sp. NPDC051567 TaxID=3365660 RepID=UPI0037B3AFDA
MSLASARIRRRCTFACASSLLVLAGTVGGATAATAAPRAEVTARAVLPAQVDPGQIVNLVNQARTQAGCQPLAVNPALTRAAQEYANDTTTNHVGSDGSTVADRLKKAGATFSASAENIAWGSGDAQTHVDGWLKSSGHAGNIKNCNFSKTGVAVAGNRIVQVFTN